jgi:uncharacterized membrane protein YccC
MARKSTDIVAFTLRLREDLRRKLERAADKAERSLNIEIVERLEASFTAEERARDQKQMMAKLDETAARLQSNFDNLMKKEEEIAARLNEMKETAKVNYAEWQKTFLRQQKEGK